MIKQKLGKQLGSSLEGENISGGENVSLLSSVALSWQATQCRGIEARFERRLESKGGKTNRMRGNRATRC